MSKKVEIYKLNNDGSQTVFVTCKLVDKEVACYGDKDLASLLERLGIIDYSDSQQINNRLFLSDGLKFLKQLKFNFKSGYLNASDVVAD